MVVQRLQKHATQQPDWPNLHGALMELHSILDAWCASASTTTAHVDAYYFGDSVTMHGGASNVGRVRSRIKPWSVRWYIEDMRSEISRRLYPAVSWWYRWSSERRRKAARKSLRSAMRIYCPDLLSEFNQAVEARSEWVKRNREHISTLRQRAESSREAQEEIEEMNRTYANLVAVRDQLAELIRQKYPMGDSS
jgi:hypothetical protein